VVKRIIVGAHYGLKDWLVQRVTALVMVLYTLLWLAIAGVEGGVDYTLWQALFANPAFRVATMLFWLALLWHAWVGMRDIWMDYLKPTALRLTVETLTVLILLAYAVWLLDLLWGPR
jgi:succinate dehydrogenase / fumarate reductase, membrane anchor subunit